MSPRDLIALAVGMALYYLADALDKNFKCTQVEWDLLMARIHAKRC